MEEQVLQMLESECRQWVEDWKSFCNKIHQLKGRLGHIAEQSLDPEVNDHVYIKNHLTELKKNLQPQIEEATDLVDSLMDNVNGDYAELIRQKDAGGASFDSQNEPRLLKAAKKILSQLWEGGEVCVTVATQKVEELEGARKQYAAKLMQDQGTPSDPGLGLLRFAVARLDQNSTTLAEQRLEKTATFRNLIEEAYAIREEWRELGPAKLGDPDLFRFFLGVIYETKLGNEPIPPQTDWTQLGRLKDHNLIRLNLIN